MAMAITTILLLLFASLSYAKPFSIIIDINDNPIQNPDGRTDDEVMGIYRDWMARHGKAYNGLGEMERRFEVFKDNLRFIDEHNSVDRTYKVGLNRFADLTNEEYRSMYLGTRTDAKRRFVKAKGASRRYAVEEGEKLPESVDWRETGAVAPIKDQGSCGSCWAFSTVAAVEAVNQIATGELIELSEQELVDCDTKYDAGCNGGLMDYAFEFIIENGGIDTESDYPYLGVDSTCDQTRKNAKVVSIDGYEDVPPYNEKALKKAVAHQPISVAIEASGREFQLYLSVFNNASVPPSAQAAFPYVFAIHKFLQAGTFDLVGTIVYEIDQHPYQSTFYNGTIEVTEAGGPLSVESVFLFCLGIALLGLLGFWIRSQIEHFSKKTKRATKVETGTKTTDASMDEWLQGTAYTQSLSSKSKKKK